MEPISVLLVDDHATFRDIAARFLQAQSDGEVAVVGSAGSGEEALVEGPRLRPQVILLDLRMPRLGGLDVLPALRLLLPEAVIIVLSVIESPEYRQAALDAGADDFVSKTAMTTDLLPAIRRATPAGKGSGHR
jgi:DNA-binding NarL/FixJ family response regulator